VRKAIKVSWLEFFWVTWPASYDFPHARASEAFASDTMVHRSGKHQGAVRYPTEVPSRGARLFRQVPEIFGRIDVIQNTLSFDW
jgi:hypothetical protein